MTAHGIEHGGDDLALDLLGLLHELGQAVEHDFEHAAQLAGLDHVDEQAVEDLGMLGQAFGEGAAAFDGQGQLADDVLEGGIRSCFSSTRRPRSSGRPASTSVANCRVKVVRTLGLTLPLRPGILMLRLTSPPFFLAPALPAGAALAFLSAFSLALSTSTTLVGNKPISLTRPMASFWLATSRVPLVSLPRESMAT